MKTVTDEDVFECVTSGTDSSTMFVDKDVLVFFSEFFKYSNCSQER
jgi:hypothetical protein